MVMLDHGTEMTYSSVVPKKGVHAYAVVRCCNDLSLLGHSKLILKSDNEPAILALKEAIQAESSQKIELTGRVKQEGEKNKCIVPEESAAYDSRSNGRIESNIKWVQGQIRTLKSSLESRIGFKLAQEHNCLPWLVRHAGWIKNRLTVKSDGRTAYERWKGKKFTQEIVEFGERVMYLKPGSKGRDKLESRWGSGIWLGSRDESQESIIGTREGCIKVRDIRRYGEIQARWNPEELNEFQGAPWGAYSRIKLDAEKSECSGSKNAGS